MTNETNDNHPTLFLPIHILILTPPSSLLFIPLLLHIVITLPDSSLCCKWLNHRNDRIVTGGNYHVRVWQIDFSLPKLHPMDVKLGSVRRVITSMDITADDSLAYCGTSTGDILKVKIERNEIQGFNDPDTIVPSLAGISKDKFSRGVKVLMCVINESSGNR